MPSKFYLKKNKDQEGPYSLKHILLFVIRGQVHLNEKLYKIKKNKIQKPLFLYKHIEFKNFFPNLSLDSNPEKTWILLKKEKESFIQSGPYLTKGLQLLLKGGLISDKDFVYTEGMEEWERLSVCSEFHTRIDSMLEDWMDKFSLSLQSETHSNKESSYGSVTYVQNSGWSQWRR